MSSNVIRGERGFTLLETIVALVILGIAAMGALAGFIAASNNVRDGQLRQFKTALAEARVQQLALADKSLIGTTAGNNTFGTVASGSFAPPNTPDTIPIGTAPWKLDPMGAFFKVTAAGVVTSVSPASIGSPTSCAVSGASTSLVCREVAVTKGMPDGSAGPGGRQAYTLWTRVVREGDPSPAGQPSLYAVVDREVVFQ